MNIFYKALFALQFFEIINDIDNKIVQIEYVKKLANMLELNESINTAFLPTKKRTYSLGSFLKLDLNVQDNTLGFAKPYVV